MASVGSLLVGVSRCHVALFVCLELNVVFILGFGVAMQYGRVIVACMYVKFVA